MKRGNAWKGGRYQDRVGRWLVWKPEHPRSLSNGYVLEHLLVAEKALGRPIPHGLEIHHVDGDPGNNDPANLVICQDKAYHKLLHRRQRALDACGHAGWRKCQYCKEHDDPRNLSIVRGGKEARHLKCQRSYRRRWEQKRSA